jgi:hypothetical protein
LEVFQEGLVPEGLDLEDFPVSVVSAAAAEDPEMVPRQVSPVFSVVEQAADKAARLDLVDFSAV